MSSQQSVLHFFDEITKSLDLEFQGKFYLKVVILLLKDYFRYKTITSQNVPSVAQANNFFIS